MYAGMYAEGDRLVGTIAEMSVKMVGRARLERATNWLKAITINDINQ